MMYTECLPTHPTFAFPPFLVLFITLLFPVFLFPIAHIEEIFFSVPLPI